MPWVPAATASIISIPLLMVSYLVYARGVFPYSPNDRIQWYPGQEKFSDHKTELAGAALAFLLSIMAVALAANPPVTECFPRSGVPFELEAFHGFVAGYYVLQIFFPPCMLWVTKKARVAASATDAASNIPAIVTKILLWTCALLQIAAAWALGTTAVCSKNAQLNTAFALQIVVVLWTTLYDGVIYASVVDKISQKIVPLTLNSLLALEQF